MARRTQNVGEYPGNDALNVPFILRTSAINRAGDAAGVTLEEELKIKRGDGHYPGVVDSLRERGWQRPITVHRKGTNGGFTVLDGHHRLAAAHDLGLTHVLAVNPGKGQRYSNDSGMWHPTDPIPPYKYEEAD
jgi:hypothetical protein